MGEACIVHVHGVISNQSGCYVLILIDEICELQSLVRLGYVVYSWKEFLRLLEICDNVEILIIFLQDHVRKLLEKASISNLTFQNSIQSVDSIAAGIPFQLQADHQLQLVVLGANCMYCLKGQRSLGFTSNIVFQCE